MNRYSEVCGKIKKTHDTMKESQRAFEKLFKEQFAAYLECSQEMIALQYGAPFVDGDSICCDFSVRVRFKNLNVDEIVALPNFVYRYKDFGGSSGHEIDYQGEYFDLYHLKDSFFQMMYARVNEQYLG